ncbi:MAG: hypothetical protein A2Y07_09780 [Planctomycetes bacterium GWF2_50_10]|nr:MAG: hypothetical protein A2Y07_09780 [Planctomycetes bacterium GWF2_50_10]
MSSKVRIYKESEPITMCGFGYDNPNPITELLGSNNETKSIYPYPLHNYHLRDKRLCQVDLIVIENEFLRVAFAPELGGRIWSAYDKTAQQEMFLHNNSFKSYMAGCGGAYIAAGMELNYPNAHSITNCMPRKVTTFEHEDGSATVRISELEMVYRTQWQISFTLRPNEARLLQHVMFYNRSHLPGRYRYWCNASAPLSDDFKFIYPEKMASEHGGSNVFTWPNYLGNDWSQYKNDHEILGLYYLEAKDDFFGYYDRSRDFGIVHHADRHQVPGKKLWTWGQTKAQQQRVAFLSEGLGKYGETQSGRPVNQEHFEFLMPQELIHWDEVWYPVSNIGNFIQATDNFAVALEELRNNKVSLNICACAPVNKLKARVLSGNRQLAEFPIRLATRELFSKKIELQKTSADELLIQFITETGAVLEEASLKGRGEYKMRSEIREEPVHDIRSSYSLYLNGAFQDMCGNVEKAASFYKKSIERDALNPEPLRNLATIYLNNGNTSEATKLLQKALDYNKWDGFARYLLGYAYFLDGKINDSNDLASTSAGMYGQVLNGNVLAAESFGRLGLYNKALKHLDSAIEHAQLNPKLRALKSAVLRKLGRKADSVKEIQALKIAGVDDILIHTEQFFLGNSQSLKNVNALVSELYYDSFRFIEAALDYIAIGLYAEAEELTSIAIKSGLKLCRLPIHYNLEKCPRKYQRQYVSPFLFLVRGYARKLQNKVDEAVSDYKKADTAQYYVFANRPELERILWDSIASIKGSGAFEYYLGTYLMSKKRYDESVMMFEKAQQKGLKFSVLFRNLAALNWKHCNNTNAAEMYYKKAIALDNDPNLYLELVSLYEVTKEAAKRRKTIMSIPEEFKRTSPMMDVVGPVLDLLAETGDPQKYNEFASQVSLCEWEGLGKGIYTATKVKLGKTLFDKGKYLEAYNEFKSATEFPKNFGTSVWYVEPILVRNEYLKAKCLKELGNTAEASQILQNIVSTNYTVWYFESWREDVNKIRFYQAMALQDVGRVSEANMVMDGVNFYRQSRGLIPLMFNLNSEQLFATADSNCAEQKIHQGPEI